jgi:hypothetical protein
MQGEITMRRLIIAMLMFVGLAFRSAFAQTTPPSSIVIDGQGSLPSITLQTNISPAGNKAGETQHFIFGPYPNTNGDPGALYIGTGQSPTGGKNNIYLYNYSCIDGCNVPKISLLADVTVLGGDLIFPDGTVQTTAAPALKHARSGGCSLSGSTLSCNITLSWSGSAFADTNYTPVCTTENAGGGTLSITGKTPASVTVTFTTFTVCVPTTAGTVCGGPPSAGISGVDCIALHD